MRFTGAKGEVKIMTLDPGHFHAALVQKVMYKQVSPEVHIYAPAGSDVKDHLNRINGFDTRLENPTNWESKVYTGDDFLEKMLADKPGNVVVISGNNRNKAEYIKACVDAGLNVLADKPMCIDRNGFELLQQAFHSAEKKGILLYDIMTERYEITSILQKILVNNSEVFGTLLQGTPENPAVTKESVHHFFKYVARKSIQRPAWYFDTDQQGEGLVDVTTHLVDLIQWECFPNQVLDFISDIEMISARHWHTPITPEQFHQATQLVDFPDFLKAKLNPSGVLPVYANGEMIYKIRSMYAKVTVTWEFQAPPGGSDTHFSVMRGSRANIVIRQGREQDYSQELYVEVPAANNTEAVALALNKAIADLQTAYPGLELKNENGSWHILIPEKYRVGHEEHFAQVTEKYLQFLVDGRLPEWEVPNMITKYHTTIAALEKALK